MGSIEAGRIRRMVLRVGCAISGTDIRIRWPYTMGESLPTVDLGDKVSTYASAVRCLVLTLRMLLRSRWSGSGTNTRVHSLSLGASNGALPSIPSFPLPHSPLPLLQHP
eukprot:3934038-Rhodomonas_salina.2